MNAEELKEDDVIRYVAEISATRGLDRTAGLRYPQSR
jgi:hypothetical protein